MLESIEKSRNRRMSKKENNALRVTDTKHESVIRCIHKANPHGHILIFDITCWAVTMHPDGSLYVADWKENEVRQWKKGETNGTVIIDGSGRDNQFAQFDSPAYLFVDNDHNLYVSDRHNHRMMKWLQGMRDGVLVATGNGSEECLIHLYYPERLMLNHHGQKYVAVCANRQVTQWRGGIREGLISIACKDTQLQANQLNHPISLSFDEDGDVHVAEWRSH